MYVVCLTCDAEADGAKAKLVTTGWSIEGRYDRDEWKSLAWSHYGFCPECRTEQYHVPNAFQWELNTKMADKPQSISRTTGHKAPSLCVFLDTETTSGKGKHYGEVEETWRLGVAIAVRRESGKWGRRELRRFQWASDLWDWIHGLESRRKPVWIFAHNLGFDLTVSDFWGYVDAGRWSTSDLWAVSGLDQPPGTKKRKPWRGSVVISDPPTILVLRSKRGAIRLVDTFNYFHGSVEEMGRSLGLEQCPIPDRADSDDMWFTRCERDAEILERTVCGWIDRWSEMGCGMWRPTAAGLGYSAWRNSLTDVKVIPNHDEKQIEFARSAYYGGQTEVFYRGNVYPSREATERLVGRVPRDFDDSPQGPVYHLDVHALYPSAMQAGPFPARFAGFSALGSTLQLAARAKFQLPIAHVTIHSEIDTYPVRRHDKYLHAVGTFSTFLAGAELLGAIDRGHVEHVHETAWYEPADLFGAFVDRWLSVRHEAKRSGDAALEELTKLVMNSLSGYFARRRICWDDMPHLAAMRRFGEWEVWDVALKKFLRYRAVGGNVQQFEGKGEPTTGFPAISAFITAAGRERMRELRGLCPPRSVLYQDTDSLFALPQARHALAGQLQSDRPTLGLLRILDTWDHLEIRGLKFYGGSDWCVCPGLKKSARVIKPGKWQQSRFQKLQSILNDYSGPKVVVQDHDFNPVGSLGNRTPTKSGWTLPPRLEEGALPF